MAKQMLVFATLLAATMLGGLGPPAAAQQRLYISADVPTDPDGPVVYQPSQVIQHDHLAALPYSLELTMPGNPTIDGLHKMDKPGLWLFSFESPTNLGGLLAMEAEPPDVIVGSNLAQTHFFDASCVTPPVPPQSNVDALYLDGGDAGDLVVSFDVPTTLGVSTFQPSQLVRWKRSALGPCGWTLVGLELDPTLGTYFPSSTNLIGAHRALGQWLLAFDIPVDLGPPVAPTRTPGQIVIYNGGSFSLFDDLQAEGAPGWAISSLVDGLACEANPGRIDSPTVQITMAKSLPTVTILYPPSCSSGGIGYGLYAGTIASLQAGSYNHAKVSCQQACCGVNFVPGNPSAYYLIVPDNGKEEGSYGLNSAGAERPQPPLPASRCVVPQNLIACP